jgi:hypothetical protein
MFVRVMFSLSAVVLPDMQHTAHGPPSSSKPNPFHSRGRQTSRLLGIHLPWLVVRFSSRGLIPRTTRSQSYLTHDYLVSSSGLALCPYGVGTRMHEISIHLHVRKNETSLLRKGTAWNLFSLIRCILYSWHRIFYRIWLTGRRPPGVVLLAQG